MKTKKNYFKWLAVAAITMFAGQQVSAQTNLGASCGCPATTARGIAINMSTLADGNGLLTATNTVLSCSNNYTLNTKIFVPSGKTLTIEPGTVIKASYNSNPANASALIVSRGGKIIASGTEECPIVFTAEADPMDGSYPIANSGKWGGIVLLGKATNNLMLSNNGPFVANSGSGKLAVANGLGVVEGFASSSLNDWYGANLTASETFDDNDNSGVLDYVSIRHSGAILSVGSEINGLTLASVGRGTKVEHIEIVSCGDDAIEIFGGTVNLKWCTQLYGNDDMFDYDQGWTGKAQFLFGMKAPWSSSQAAATVTATVSNGVVNAVTCNPCGTGYTTAPTLFISGGTPTSGQTITPAVVTCTISNGAISGFTISNAGANYSTAPSVTVVGGGIGIASPDSDNGFECDSDDQQSNTTPKAHPVIYNATIIGNGKSIGSSDNKGLAAINMKEDAEGEIYNSIFANFKNGLNLETATATNYTNGNTYSAWTANTAQPTTTAVAEGVLTTGTVTSVTISNAGAGYAVAPIVAFTAAPSGGTTAKGTAIVSQTGTITGITITEPGTGYLVAPTVTFTPYVFAAQNTLKVKCNTFVGVTNPLTIGGSTLNGSAALVPTTGNSDYTKFTSTDNNTVVPSLPGFNATALAFSNVNTSTTITAKNDVIPTPAIALGSGCSQAPTDGFFSPATYRGAFASENDNWLTDWSYSNLVGAIKGIVACPTDLNFDGVTNVLDFNLFAPAFGLSCE